MLTPVIILIKTIIVIVNVCLVVFSSLFPMAAGPTAWNNLPASIRSVKSTDSFKRQLKTRLFRLA